MTPGSIHLTVEGTLAASGALDGRITVRLRGAPAEEARAGRIAGFAPRALGVTLAPAKGQDGETTLAGSVRMSGFAHAQGTGLSLTLPWLERPGASYPITQQYRIALPEEMRPVELPSPFSVVTPEGGRYAIHALLEEGTPAHLVVQRDLSATGPSVSDLLEAAKSRDGLRLVLGAVRPGGTKGR